MPSKPWPFYPDRLTNDIWSEEQVRFFQSGAAVRTKLPMSIVELRPGEAGEPTPYYIPTDDKWLNYSDFCKFLRDEPEDGKSPFLGGDSACRACDKRMALEFLQGRLKPKLGGTGVAYQCDMDLWDYVAPIEVNGRRVAALFGGQRRPESPEEVQEIFSRVDKIGTAESPIQSIRGAKETLKSLIAKIPPRTDDTLTKLELQAKIIGDFATERWKLDKGRSEEEFLASLQISDTADEQALDKELARLLQVVVEWCGVDFSFVAVTETPGRDILKKFIQSGLQPGMRNPAPQLNWAKVANQISGNLSFEGMIDKRSLLGALPTDNAAQIESRVGFVYAISLVTEHRLIFSLGRRRDATPLLPERAFLERLAARVGHAYLERKQFLELKAREEQWEDIASLLSHEVRGQLQPIVAGTDLLRVHISDPNDWASKEDANNALNAIANACDTLATYEAEILEFWDWIAGKNHRQFTLRSLSEAVKASTARLRAVAEKATLRIVVDPSINMLPQVDALGKTLEIAIGHILENAIKYSFDNRYIEVKTADELRGHVILKIENYGIGIPEEEREKVFEKRYRGKHRGRRMPREGEGLGLWQVAEIMKAHGGTIKCYSIAGDRERQPKPGDVECFKTTFTMMIPRSQSRRHEEEW